MKYLTTTFAIAFMAFGFTSTSAFANENNPFDNPGGVGTGCVDPNTGNIIEGTDWTNCDHYHTQNEIDDLNEFADSEGGSGGDFGESGGSDFGEGDRAAASTAAE